MLTVANLTAIPPALPVTAFPDTPIPPLRVLARDARAVMGREACMLAPSTSSLPATGRGVRAMPPGICRVAEGQSFRSASLRLLRALFGRLTSCYKCHYTQGYIGAVEQTAKPFHEFSYFPLTPVSVVPKDTPNVSCSVCHDPDDADTGNPYGLRTGSAGTACDTCHYEKWQNAILEGLAGTFENAYHYPGENYTPYLGAGMFIAPLRSVSCATWTPR